MKNGDAPAFHQATEWNPISDLRGLTKREYFAALAMQAMLSNHKYFNLPIDQLCGFATVASDKLLNALES